MKRISPLAIVIFFIAIFILPLFPGPVSYIPADVEAKVIDVGDSKQTNIVESAWDDFWNWFWGIEPSPDWEIEGNVVYIDLADAFIAVTPHTLEASGWVEVMFYTKDYSGPIDIVAGFEGTDGVQVRDVEIWEEYEHTLYRTIDVQRDDSYTPEKIISTKAVSVSSVDVGDKDLNSNVAEVVVEGFDPFTDNLTQQTVTIAYNSFDGKTFEYKYWTKEQEAYYETFEDWNKTSTIAKSKVSLADCEDWQSATLNNIVQPLTYYTARIWVNLPIRDLGDGTYGSRGKYVVGVKPQGAAIADAWLLDPWYDVSWGYRVKATIDSGVIDANLTDFPLLMYISGASGKTNADITFIFDELVAASQKFAVTVGEDGNECFCEVEEWDNIGEEAWIWVSANTTIASGADTDLYFYYDVGHANNGNVGLLADGSGATEGVWDANYKLVYHLVDDVGGDVDDSTSNSNDGTKANTPVEGAAKVYDGQGYNANDDGISSDANLAAMSNFTLETWVAFSNAAGGASDMPLDIPINDPSMFRYSDEKIHIYADGAQQIVSTTLIDNTNWHHLVIMADGTNIHLYIDGVEDASSPVLYAGDSANAKLWVGDNSIGTDTFAGTIDEARVSNTNRSAAWIKASYYSGDDNLLTWGTEETAPAGGAPTVVSFAATSVEETTATVSGNVTVVNDTNITQRGFVWGTTCNATLPSSGEAPPASYDSSWTESDNWTTGTFSSTGNITGLSAGTCYYYRATANNSDGLWGYSAEYAFHTKPEAPTNIVCTSGNATCSQTWTKGTGAENTTIRYQTLSYPPDRSSGTETYNGTGTSDNTTGLVNGTTYYFVSWASSTCNGTVQFSDLTDNCTCTPATVPLVDTLPATNVEETTATLSGNITDLQGAANCDYVGFRYGPGIYSINQTTNVGAPYGIGTWSYNAAGLCQGCCYHVQAQGHGTGTGWGYGAQQTFLTKPSPPAALNCTSGNGSCSMTWNLGTGSTNTTIRYQAGSYPPDRASGTETYNGTGTSDNTTGLVNGTTYYFVAFGATDNCSLTAYSDTTANCTCTPATVPLVDTLPATVVEETTATLSGNITDLQGAPNCDWVGFRYGPGVYSINQTTNVGAPYGIGTWTYNAAGLCQGCCYHVQAQAHGTGTGWGYGAQQTFLTKPSPPAVLNCSSGNTWCSMTWALGTGSTNTTIRYQAGSYPPDRASGTETYNGTGTSDNTTGLVNGTTYYFVAFGATDNCSLTAYSDTTANCTCTPAIGPSVTTLVATNVEETTATVSGNITNLGGAANCDFRGFLYGRVSDPAPPYIYTVNQTTAGAFGIGDWSYNIPGPLDQGVCYYYRAQAHGLGATWSYGGELSFLTKPNPPTAFTCVAANASMVTLNWTEFGLADNYTYIRGKLGSWPTNYGDGAYSYNGTGSTDNHSGLASGQSWYYRAWTWSSACGHQQYSDLSANCSVSIPGAPTVQTQLCSGFGQDWAIVNGEVLNMGIAATSIAQRGFDYGLTTAYGSTILDAGVWGAGKFDEFLGSMSPGTVYHYRGRALNNLGFWGYGADMMLATKGSPVPYEHWNTSCNMTGIDIYANQWAYQTFTTANSAMGVSHSISSVYLDLERMGLPGDLDVSIRRTTGNVTHGEPTGADIMTGVIDADVIATTPTWYKIDMSPETCLTTNTTYAIVTRALAGSNTSFVNWSLDPTAGYADGNAGKSTDGSVSWTSNATVDYCFEIWGDPCLEVGNAKVFTDYRETGDWLITVRYINLYPPYYNAYNVKNYFVLQFVDSAGTVQAQVSCPSWDYKPGSIYLAASEVIGLTYGGDYTVRLYGTFPDNPFASYAIQPSDWMGNDLTQLDNWVITSAKLLGDYYGAVMTTYIADKGEVLNEVGGVIFSIGITALTTARPHLFQIVSTPTIPPTGAFPQAGEGVTTWQTVMGPDITARLGEVGGIVGVSGKVMAAWMLIGTMLALMVWGLPTGHTAPSNILAIPILLMGLGLRVFDWATGAVMLTLMVFLLMYNLWFKYG